MFDRFTERARKVMTLARQEAQKLNNDYIGTEHILLGLVQEGSGVAAAVLRNLGVDLRKVRAEVERLVEQGKSPVSGTMLPFTPRAKRVLERSLEEAQHLGHNYIGTEHLLLGLIREADGPAAHVFQNLGVKVEEVRDGIRSLLGVEPGAARGTGDRDRSSPALHAHPEEMEALRAGAEARLRERLRALDPPWFREDRGDLQVSCAEGAEGWRFTLWLGHEPTGEELRTEIVLFSTRVEHFEEHFAQILAVFEKLAESEERGRDGAGPSA